MQLATYLILLQRCSMATALRAIQNGLGPQIFFEGIDDHASLADDRKADLPTQVKRKFLDAFPNIQKISLFSILSIAVVLRVYYNQTTKQFSVHDLFVCNLGRVDHSTLLLPTPPRVREELDQLDVEPR